jgi:hypothetical protein
MYHDIFRPVLLYYLWLIDWRSQADINDLPKGLDKVSMAKA